MGQMMVKISVDTDLRFTGINSNANRVFSGFGKHLILIFLTAQIRSFEGLNYPNLSQ